MDNFGMPFIGAFIEAECVAEFHRERIWQEEESHTIRTITDE